GAADLAAGYIYDVSFGDGDRLSIPQEAGNAAGVPVVHEYGEPGTYLIQATATDTNGVVGPLTTFSVFVGDATVENMNAAIGETVELGGSIFLLELDTEQELNLLLITIATLGDNAGATFDIVVTSNANRPNLRVSVPAGYRLILNGMTFVGGSPAFILDAGEVIVNGGITVPGSGSGTFVNTTPNAAAEITGIRHRLAFSRKLPIAIPRAHAVPMISTGITGRRYRGAFQETATIPARTKSIAQSMRLTHCRFRAGHRPTNAGSISQAIGTGARSSVRAKPSARSRVG
ncbi:MAG: hypothetical protein IIC51_10455, partial [Planctomycetes bacterium]|nr:hypothetical protein [Planctomycetota bacterium]